MLCHPIDISLKSFLLKSIIVKDHSQGVILSLSLNSETIIVQSVKAISSISFESIVLGSFSDNLEFLRHNIIQTCENRPCTFEKPLSAKCR